MGRIDNQFGDCTTVSQLMRQVVGAGSSCWILIKNLETGVEERVFDDQRAIKISRDATARMAEINWLALSKTVGE